MSQIPLVVRYHVTESRSLSLLYNGMDQDFPVLLLYLPITLDLINDRHRNRYSLPTVRSRYRKLTFYVGYNGTGILLPRSSSL